MTEEFVNPLDDDNFITGGGLWDGKTITVLGSEIGLEHIKYGDGSPWLDKDGQPGVRRVWRVTGTAEDEDRERSETYSIGGLQPTADGEGFTNPRDGTPGKLHVTSEAGRFASALKKAGYDVAGLFNNKTGLTVVSRLIGARITFKAEPKLTKDGKVKTNKKGYVENYFFPQAYVGQAAGLGKGNGAVVDPDLQAFAQQKVVELLTENGGSMARADLFKNINKKLSGDARAVAVVGLLAQDGFYVDSPVVREGTQVKLAA